MVHSLCDSKAKRSTGEDVNIVSRTLLYHKVNKYKAKMEKYRGKMWYFFQQWFYLLIDLMYFALASLKRFGTISFILLIIP